MYVTDVGQRRLRIMKERKLSNSEETIALRAAGFYPFFWERGIGILNS